MTDHRKLSTSGKSLYELLEIPQNASLEDIKRAYRKKALKCHPDKNRGDEAQTELFKQINHANAVLTDEGKKKIYDVYGSFGIYMAGQIGEERFKAYMLSQNPCIKALFIISCLLTGCCCCCCCCCCFNFCCGKCKPDMPNYDDSSDSLDEDDVTNDDKAPIIDQQPTSSGAPKDAAIAMPPPPTASDSSPLSVTKDVPDYGTNQ